MKVYIGVTDDIDLIKLQSALDPLTDWADKWQLQLSVDILNLGKPQYDVALTYIRPLLEFNSIIWSPYLKQDNKRVEQVPIRFTWLKKLHI